MDTSQTAESSKEGQGGSQPPAVSSASSLDTFYAAAFPNGTNDLLDCDASATRVQQLGKGIKLPTPQTPMLQTASGSVTLPSAPVGGSVPEFLYQLTRMLTDNNRDIIEWTKDRIEVHNPYKLESHVLHRYFRHSKFASFQRQLNYFGFRKLAGKGKMAPCSYVNESASGDIGCLLLVKRKVPTGHPKDKDKRNRLVTGKSSKLSKPVPSQFLSSSTNVLKPVAPTKMETSAYVAPVTKEALPQQGSHKALARTAVGKGIRHRYTAADCQRVRPRQAEQLDLPFAAATATATTAPPQPSSSASSLLNDPLSELASNYQSSLNDIAEREQDTFPTMGFLSRNSSLVDLAIIPDVAECLPPANPETASSTLFTFVDFPNPEVKPKGAREGGNNDGVTEVDR